MLVTSLRFESFVLLKANSAIYSNPKYDLKLMLVSKLSLSETKSQFFKIIFSLHKTKLNL